jgi:VanZ family protein
MSSRNSGQQGPGNGTAIRSAAPAVRTIRQRSRSPWLPFSAGVLICSYFLFRQAPVPQLFANSDKVGHAGAFFALVILGYLSTSRINARLVVVSTGLLMLAVTSEWIQHTALLPLRHGNVWDLAADLSGWALGLTVIAWLHQRQRWSLCRAARS